jgi:aryl-alcohol dehydrogenase-like predicted oxidoreductase
MKRVERIAPITSLQPNYNIVTRDIEKDVLPFCREQHIGVIVYSPMKSGLLTGKMTRERIASLPPDDFRAMKSGIKSRLHFAALLCVLVASLHCVPLVAQDQDPALSRLAAVLDSMPHAKKIDQVAISPDGTQVAYIVDGQLTVTPGSGGASAHDFRGRQASAARGHMVGG